MFRGGGILSLGGVFRGDNFKEGGNLFRGEFSGYRIQDIASIPVDYQFINEVHSVEVYLYAGIFL